MLKKLLAVDPSLTASGWAVFCVETEQPLAIGILKPPGPKFSMEKRLGSLQEDVMLVFDRLGLGEEDYLVCEGPAPLVKNPASSLKVERVRGIFEAVARSRGLSVPGRLNPRTVQTELLGMKGPQLARKLVKPWARETVNRLYGSSLGKLLEGVDSTQVPQDIIDALLIGCLAVRRVGFARQNGMAEHEAFAPRGRSSASSRSARWSEKDLIDRLKGNQR